jgi:quinol monooxygenase YgiN
VQPYFVWVELTIAPADRARFLDLARENAAQSVAREPGCTRFDVLESADDGPVALYEIYDDEAAFKAHLLTEHFHVFNDATKALIQSKQWRCFAGTEHAKA